jgi:hypothetical protein
MTNSRANYKFFLYYYARFSFKNYKRCVIIAAAMRAAFIPSFSVLLARQPALSALLLLVSMTMLRLISYEPPAWPQQLLDEALFVTKKRIPVLGLPRGLCPLFWRVPRALSPLGTPIPPCLPYSPTTILTTIIPNLSTLMQLTSNRRCFGAKPLPRRRLPPPSGQ